MYPKTVPLVLTHGQTSLSAVRACSTRLCFESLSMALASIFPAYWIEGEGSSQGILGLLCKSDLFLKGSDHLPATQPKEVPACWSRCARLFWFLVVTSRGKRQACHCTTSRASVVSLICSIPLSPPSKRALPSCALFIYSIVLCSTFPLTAPAASLTRLCLAGFLGSHAQRAGGRFWCAISRAEAGRGIY